MKAAVFRGANKPLTIEEIDVDEPMAHEVVLRVVASGVCHSDLHFIEGTYTYLQAPGILGHEGAGIVEAVGSQVDYVKPGDHVITSPSVFCGSCENCLTGRPNICLVKPQRSPDQPPRLRVASTGEAAQTLAQLGTYAEKMLVHENALAKIPEDMPLDRAALIGCGVTTGVGAALNTAKVEPGSTVAVFGCGGVGLSVVQGAYIAGARQIIAVDMGEYKLGTAREMGATDLVDASEGDPVQAIVEMTGGGVDYSFEAIGLKETTEQAFYSLKVGGTATLIGMIPEGQEVHLDGVMLRAERKIQGCSMGSNRFRVDMPRYIELYKQGRLRLDEMITRRRPLDEINDAFRAMKDREVTRTVLTFD